LRPALHIKQQPAPEEDAIVIRWFGRGDPEPGPIDLIVWHGGGFVATFAAFRLRATKETLRLFAAGQA